MQPEFEFRGVKQYFLDAQSEPFLVVQDINLVVPSGRFMSIIGPSGCGKSTLLNMASGLLRPTSGTVLRRGQEVLDLENSVGYLTQQDHLLPWRTVEKNVGMALEIRGVPRKERRERVERALTLVGLQGFGRSYPHQLSGGMRKRAALARIFIYEPSILLMDEPFSSLDAQLRVVMQRELLDLWERERNTVLFVTHDLEEAIMLSDEIIVFGARPGTIIHRETVTLPRPRDPMALRSDPSFIAVWERLWGLIEKQLEAASETKGTP